MFCFLPPVAVMKTSQSRASPDSVQVSIRVDCFTAGSGTCREANWSEEHTRFQQVS